MKKSIYLNRDEADFLEKQEAGYIRKLIQEKMVPVESVVKASKPPVEPNIVRMAEDNTFDATPKERCGVCGTKLNVNKKCVLRGCENFLK